jgi:hypothetical protein
VYVLKAKLADGDEALQHNADAYLFQDTIEASVEKPLPELDGYEVRSSVAVPHRERALQRGGQGGGGWRERERESRDNFGEGWPTLMAMRCAAAL